MKFFRALLTAVFIISVSQQAQAGKDSCFDIGPYLDAGAQLISSAPEEAMKVYTEAVTLCPSSANAHYNLALGSLNQGNFKAAYGYIGKALELAPESMPIKSLYIAILVSGKVDKAKGKSMFERETAANPNDPDLSKAKVAFILSEAKAVGKIYSPLVAMEGMKVFVKGQYKVRLVDGTVTDTQNGLMWEYANNEYLNHTKAEKYCQGLRLGGYENWSLPKKEQIRTLVVEGKTPRRSKPMFNGDVFPERPVKRYWLQEKLIGGVGDYGTLTSGPPARTFNMERAKLGEHDSDSKKHVWCVREIK